MDITFGDRRTITDWLAIGKYAICHGCRQVDKAQSQGLAVDDFDTGDWKEGQQLSTEAALHRADQGRAESKRGAGFYQFGP